MPIQTYKHSHIQTFDCAAFNNIIYLQRGQCEALPKSETEQVKEKVRDRESNDLWKEES